MSNLSLLTIGDYYDHSRENGEKENGDRTGIWFGVLVGVRGCDTVNTGHSLVTLLFLSVSVKDRSLHKTLGKSQIYYPEHILGYGRLEVLLLSCRGSSSFRTDCLRGFWVRRSLHRTESGTHEQGLRVLVWTGTWTPRTGG